MADLAANNGPDQRPLILGLCIACPIVAIASVILRFEARRLKNLRLGADDWTILAALILSLGVSIDILIDSRVGNMGGHTPFDADGIPILDNQFTAFGQTTFVIEVLLWPCVGIIKISVLLFYKRIFSPSKSFRNLIWGLIGVMVAWTLAFEFAITFSCLPVSSHWDPTIPYQCVDLVSLFTAALATDVITDGGILLLPVYSVYKLQMPVYRKLAIIGIFLLGGLVTVTGIIRIHYLTLMYSALSRSTFDDVEYYYAAPYYWTVIEVNVGILSACLPTMRPLYEGYGFNTLTSKVRSSFGSSRSQDTIRTTDKTRLNPSDKGYSDLDSKTSRKGSKAQYYDRYLDLQNTTLGTSRIDGTAEWSEMQAYGNKSAVYINSSSDCGV